MNELNFLISFSGILLVVLEIALFLFINHCERAEKRRLAEREGENEHR